MKLNSKFCTIFLFLLFPTLAFGAPKADYTNLTPTKENAQTVGFYSNGCIVGAQRLPEKSAYYQILRPDQKRYYGHPQLIDYIKNLALKANKANLPMLLIGDMAMARGGRFIGGHVSHQNGLDVDIWLKMVKKPLTYKELLKPTPLYVVSSNYKTTNSNFSNDIITLLKLSSEDEKVERIFINAAIKNEICKRIPDSKDRMWLQKLRPWAGHMAHLHVRLSCPDNAQFCEKQLPIPDGDGCEEAAQIIAEIGKPKKPDPNYKPPKRPAPNSTCLEVLNNPKFTTLTEFLKTKSAIKLSE